MNYRSIAQKSLLFVLALAFSTGWALAGGTEQESAAGETGEGLTSITLMLDWVPNVNHVGIFVARDQGFFAEQGLAVEIIEPGEVYATSAVIGGQADFGIDFQESVTMLRTQGVPVVSIAAILQTNTSGFATRSGDGIDGPGDFGGLTYGTFNSPFEEPTLSALVSAEGGDPATIRYVTAGTDLLAILDQGLADVVWIYYGTQGFQAQRIGLDIDYFPLSDYQDVIPNYYTPVVITSRKYLETNPQIARKFLAALSAAHEFVVQDPLTAAGTLAAAVPELDEQELIQSVPWVSQFMLGDQGWGHQTLETWESYGQWMSAAGVLEGEFDARTAFTTEFLP